MGGAAVSRQVRRACLTLGLVIGIAIPAQAQSSWYAAYEDALKAIDRQQWEAAERLLLFAVRAHPHQSRNELFYGTRREVYLPEFHLARVYIHVGREADAIKLLDKVSAEGLVPNRSPESAEVQRVRSVAEPVVAQNREAEARAAQERVFADRMQRARDALASGQVAEARAFATEARGTGIDPGAVAALLTAIDRGAQIAETISRARQAIAEQQDGEAQRQRDLLAQLDRTNGALPELDAALARIRAAKAPAGTSTGANTATAVVPTGSPPNSATVAARAGGVASRAIPRQALQEFFAGRYDQAIRLLEGRTDAPSLLYLAFSNVALGLMETGKTREFRLSRGHQLYAEAARERSGPTAVERTFISPSILRELERAPQRGGRSDGSAETSTEKPARAPGESRESRR